MNLELKRFKKQIEAPTPIEQAWGKLLEKNSIHPKAQAIERFVYDSGQFSEEVQKKFEQHFGICDHCQRIKEDTKPLLQQAS